MSEEPFKWGNVVDVSEVMEASVQKFQASADEAKKFGDGMRAQIAKWRESKQLERCAEHDRELPINEDKSFSKSWFNKQIILYYDRCPECLEDESRLLVNEKWKGRGIPEKTIHATFNNYITSNHAQEKAKTKCLEQARKKKGFLILRGKVGTGKTHLATACIKRIGDGLFVTQADLIGELRQTYADNSGQEKMVNRYRHVKCLVLDELTTDVKGGDIPQLLYRILAYRYDQDLFTVITSNETLNTILDILGDRLGDRVKHSYTVATMEWESYRKESE